jgi:DNA-binding IclR family transcriptional regulator
MPQDEKDIILKILEKEPRGLTIQEISRLGNMSRNKVTMFVHELLGAEKVTERKLGAYKLYKKIE